MLVNEIDWPGWQRYYTGMCVATVSKGATSGTTVVPSNTPTPSSFGVCWRGDSDCPVCPSGQSESFASHIL